MGVVGGRERTGVQASVFPELGADDPEQLGAYPLVARLGAGGMGKVYLSHTPAGRPVALKAIRPELADDPDFRHRFRQEVAAAQRVQGLYTAAVIDSDTDGTPAWLATAYVPGPTLAAAVARHGPLPLSTVLLLAAGVAEALQAVHEAGIVHRDLKPSNVLLATDGPRVIDFGIAQAADSTALTNTGVFVGTPAFMSPEQATGKRLGPAIDVFSLGQIVVFAAKGTPAFGAGQTHGVLYRIVHEEPDLTGVPEVLLPLAERCLAKDPDERPALAEVIELCRAASEGGRLARSENWLPEAVATDVSRHEAVPGPETAVRGRGRGAAERGSRAARRDHTAAVAASAPDPVPAPDPASAPGATSASDRAFPTSTAGHPDVADPTRPMGRPSPRPRRRRARIAVLACLGVLAVVVGLGVVGSSGHDSTAESRAGSSSGRGADDGSGPRRPNPHPKKFTYRGIHLSGRQDFVQFKDDPIKPTATIDGSTSDMEWNCKWVGGGCVFEAYRAKIFPLRAAQKGSLDTCLKATQFTSTFTGDGRIGSQFCVTTTAGDIVLVTYKGPDPTTQPAEYPVDIDIDIWRDAFPKDAY